MQQFDLELLLKDLGDLSPRPPFKVVGPFFFDDVHGVADLDGAQPLLPVVLYELEGRAEGHVVLVVLVVQLEIGVLGVEYLLEYLGQLDVIFVKELGGQHQAIQ